MYCVICDGILEILGGLGKLVWFRCRDCGMDQNRECGELDCSEDC
jgi:hypothetical protein